MEIAIVIFLSSGLFLGIFLLYLFLRPYLAAVADVRKLLHAFPVERLLDLRACVVSVRRPRW